MIKVRTNGGSGPTSTHLLKDSRFAIDPRLVLLTELRFASRWRRCVLQLVKDSILIGSSAKSASTLQTATEMSDGHS